MDSFSFGGFFRLWCFEVSASNQYMYQYPFSRHFISPTFLFSVSFPYWAKLRIIIGREKVPSSLLFWPKNDWRKTNLLPCGQTALATVWKVLSRYGTCQNLLIVPHFVLYNVCGPFYLSNEAATILIIHHTKATFFLLFRMVMTPIQHISTWLMFKRSLMFIFSFLQTYDK